MLLGFARLRDEIDDGHRLVAMRAGPTPSDAPPEGLAILTVLLASGAFSAGSALMDRHWDFGAPPGAHAAAVVAVGIGRDGAA
ncbi:MAG: hypothetical protein ACYDC5_00140 [Candidatus Dormibacteria bacterium]